MSGCSALQLAGVAAGKYVSSLSDTVKAWDFAAGAVLVREAGGVIAALDGELAADSAVVIAANSQDTLERIRRIG
jgi:myo-inositol-1(or 4)-monophosphatase